MCTALVDATFPESLPNPGETDVARPARMSCGRIWHDRIDRRPHESLRRSETDGSRMAAILVGPASAGWVLVGSFAVALAVGLWTWGTWLGWGFFAFAFITQVTSVTDVLRQVSFPIYPSRTAFVFVSSGLALLLYFPSLFVMWVVARPGFEADGAGSGFLVNCWAYHGAAQPREGQWIWMKLPTARRTAGGPGGRGFGPGSRMDRVTLACRRARLLAPFDPASGGVAASVPIQGPVRSGPGRARRRRAATPTRN